MQESGWSKRRCGRERERARERCRSPSWVEGDWNRLCASRLPDGMVAKSGSSQVTGRG